MKAIKKKKKIQMRMTIRMKRQKKYTDTTCWGSPNVGNNVFIGAGAKIIGKIAIGDNCKIGAGCIVVKNVPAGTTCVLSNARIIHQEKDDNC